jgi:hypothetical protein
VDAALADRLTLACALEVERRAALAGGARAALVGLGAAMPLPDGLLVSFGLAGSLVPGLEAGTLITAAAVVDPDGRVLWEGPSLDVPGVTVAIVCAAADAVTDPGERASLAARSGATAVDLESGVLAKTGRLAGVVRAISDGAEEQLGRLVEAGKRDGGTDWAVVARAAVLEPVRTARTARGARRALAALEGAAAALAGGGR